MRHANRDAQSGAIMTYLTQKNGQVSLKEAAEYFCYQANYFSRLYRKLFATDFVHLRRNIRINLAEDQLLLTNKKLEEIADELGYQDLSSFSKAFAESTGHSPGKYRKKYGIKTSRWPSQRLVCCLSYFSSISSNATSYLGISPAPMKTMQSPL